MTKLLIPIILLTLLLSGCSKDDNKEIENPPVDSSNQTTESTNENLSNNVLEELEDPNFENYGEIYNYVSEQGSKLETFLKNNNIEYGTSPNNHTLLSKGTVYEMYEQEYTQSFEFSNYVTYDHYEDNFVPNGSLRLEMEKEYHIEDEIKSDDGYFKLFYNLAKLQDPTLTEEDLLTTINEHRTNQSSITLYETEDEKIRIYSGDTFLRLSANVAGKYTTNEIGDETSNYETVNEFFERGNDYVYENDNYDTVRTYEDTKLVDSSHNIGYAIEYNQVESGDLSETYNFTLRYDLSDETASNSYNESVKMPYLTMPQGVKEVIPAFFDMINEHVGFDIRTYMLEEQFIGEVEEMMFVDRYEMTADEVTGMNSVIMQSPLPGGNNIGVSYNEELDERPLGGSIFIREHEGITISIDKKVIAEGKSVL